MNRLSLVNFTTLQCAKRCNSVDVLQNPYVISCDIGLLRLDRLYCCRRAAAQQVGVCAKRASGVCVMLNSKQKLRLDLNLFFKNEH